jgi:hypothetical protein
VRVDDLFSEGAEGEIGTLRDEHEVRNGRFGDGSAEDGPKENPKKRDQPKRQEGNTYERTCIPETAQDSEEGRFPATVRSDLRGTKADRLSRVVSEQARERDKERRVGGRTMSRLSPFTIVKLIALMSTSPFGETIGTLSKMMESDSETCPRPSRTIKVEKRGKMCVRLSS